MEKEETVSFMWSIALVLIVAIICLTIIKETKTHEEYKCFRETKYELCLKGTP